MLGFLSKSLRAAHCPSLHSRYDTIERVRPLVSPQLPPRDSETNDYTLILDLDETLLHTEWFQTVPQRYIVHERPFVREFLQSLKSLPVEVVIFTAALQSYADTVITIMDRNTQAIKHRLYRQHTSLFQGQRFKDLSLLKRDLSKTLIVDNSPYVFFAQPDNGCVIKPWEGHLCVSTHSGIKRFMVVDDFSLIYLFFWIECLCTQQISVPQFIKCYRHLIEEALEQGTVYKDINQYRPPFPLGVESISLLNRCLALQHLSLNKPTIALARPVLQPKHSELHPECKDVYFSSALNCLYV